MKTLREPYRVELKPEFAAVYEGSLELGCEYEALLSPDNPTTMHIIGTEYRHAVKSHFTIRPPA